MTNAYFLRTLSQLETEAEELYDGTPARKDALNQILSVIKVTIGHIQGNPPDAEIAATEAIEFAEDKIKNIVDFTAKYAALQMEFDVAADTMRSSDFNPLK